MVAKRKRGKRTPTHTTRRKRRRVGGDKLKAPWKPGFTPIWDMIASDGARLKTLTVDSLYGFLVELHIQPGNSEYKRLNRTTRRFDTDQHHFVLKFCILTQNEDEKLPKYDGKLDKRSSSKYLFCKEAELQQTIWKKSIRGGRSPLCPSVTHFSIMENHDFLQLLSVLLSHPPLLLTIEKSRPVFEYLASALASNQGYDIGILVMPKLENSMTMGSCFHSRHMLPSTREDAYVRICAQLIQLYIDIHVMHFDLHTGNSLVSVEPDDQGDPLVVDTVLIDFGRASDLNQPTDDDYFTSMEKQAQLLAINVWNDAFWRAHRTNQEDLKRDFVFGVLKEMMKLDSNKNQTLFGTAAYANKKYPFQMGWVAQFQPNDASLVAIYNRLANNMTTLGLSLSDERIRQWEKKGVLVDFTDLKKNPEEDWLVPLPQSLSAILIQQQQQQQGFSSKAPPFTNSHSSSSPFLFTSIFDLPTQNGLTNSDKKKAAALLPSSSPQQRNLLDEWLPPSFGTVNTFKKKRRVVVDDPPSSFIPGNG